MTNIAEEILAEMALSAAPADESPCHFTRLPLELRKRIYALLLFPAPVPRVHCSVSAHSKQCSPGGRFLASTCKPTAAITRTISCGTCEWRGGDTHTSIMSTNKAINAEASEVLYENCQVLFVRQGRASRIVPISRPLEGALTSRIRRIVIALSPEPLPCRLDFLSEFPGLKVIEIHLDVDLTKGAQDVHRAGAFRELNYLKESETALEFVVDVHITRAWDDPYAGWGEPVTRRGEISEARAVELDEVAYQMRLNFVDELREMFRAQGKTLVVRDN